MAACTQQAAILYTNKEVNERFSLFIPFPCAVTLVYHLLHL